MRKQVLLIAAVFVAIGAVTGVAMRQAAADVTCTEWEEDEDGEYCVCWADDVSMREWCE